VIRSIVAVTAVVTIGLCGGTALAAGSTATSAGGVAFVKPLAHSWISQGFGCTNFAFEAVDLACPGHHWHSGIDLAAALGTPVMATLGGAATVLISATGYGLHVIIDHGGGLSSLYGHLDTVTIVTGDIVTPGEVIGTVGATGNATGPHLHFEIRRDGVAEDPRRDLALP
jgi:murein DD-endopeptidase MepM/ murein hydrolase activator NlpD